MKVFVTGTGRCGTVTFSKACSHISNYDSGHERYSTKLFNLENIKFPKNIIEVDPHFANFLPLMIELYPKAKWVHLVRVKEKCVKSIAHSTGIKLYSRFASMNRKVNSNLAAKIYYDVVNANISKWLENTDYKVMHLEKISQEWAEFWEWIGAKGDFDASLHELKIKHNDGKTKYGKKL